MYLYDLRNDRVKNRSTIISAQKSNENMSYFIQINILSKLVRSNSGQNFFYNNLCHAINSLVMEYYFVTKNSVVNWLAITKSQPKNSCCLGKVFISLVNLKKVVKRFRLVCSRIIKRNLHEKKLFDFANYAEKIISHVYAMNSKFFRCICLKCVSRTFKQRYQKSRLDDREKMQLEFFFKILTHFLIDNAQKTTIC